MTNGTDGNPPKQVSSVAQSAGIGIAGALVTSLVTSMCNGIVESKKLDVQVATARLNAELEERKLRLNAGLEEKKLMVAHSSLRCMVSGTVYDVDRGNSPAPNVEILIKNLPDPRDARYLATSGIDGKFEIVCNPGEFDGLTLYTAIPGAAVARATRETLKRDGKQHMNLYVHSAPQ
jgi:hypothetical protein